MHWSSVKCIIAPPFGRTPRKRTYQISKACKTSRHALLLELENNYDHVTPILQQLAWLPVECMLKLRDAVMTFKCMKGLAPPYLCDKFEMRSKIHSVNTRNKDKLDIPLYNSASGQRTFHYIAQCLFGMSSQIILKTLTLWTGF